MKNTLKFESFANSERYKTLLYKDKTIEEFESFANSERYKTFIKNNYTLAVFESFANSERYKTGERTSPARRGLRALLIQKDTKLIAAF